MPDTLDTDVTDVPVTIEVASGDAVVEITGDAPITIDVQQDAAPVVEVVQSTSEFVEVVEAGPQGPRGPKGPPGADGHVIVHEQVKPAGTWIIPHDFGRFPVIAAFDDDGIRILPDEHVSISAATLIFASPTTGTAVLK